MPWIATMVEWAEAEGVGYAELAEVVADDLVESVEDTRPPTGSYDPCELPVDEPRRRLRLTGSKWVPHRPQTTAGIRFRSRQPLVRSASRSAPLLFISGSGDHLMPPKIQQSNAKHYKAAGTITEVTEFEGPHLLPSIEGWQEVADYALDWALRHAKTDDSDPA